MDASIVQPVPAGLSLARAQTLNKINKAIDGAAGRTDALRARGGNRSWHAGCYCGAGVIDRTPQPQQMTGLWATRASSDGHQQTSGTGHTPNILLAPLCFMEWQWGVTSYRGLWAREKQLCLSPQERRLSGDPSPCGAQRPQDARHGIGGLSIFHKDGNLASTGMSLL